MPSMSKPLKSLLKCRSPGQTEGFSLSRTYDEAGNLHPQQVLQGMQRVQQVLRQMLQVWCQTSPPLSTPRPFETHHWPPEVFQESGQPVTLLAILAPLSYSVYPTSSPTTILNSHWFLCPWGWPRSCQEFTDSACGATSDRSSPGLQLLPTSCRKLDALGTESEPKKGAGQCPQARLSASLGLIYFIYKIKKLRG